MTGNLPALNASALTNLDAADVSGTHTNFTSTGIDDNADATTITIDSRENVGIGVVPESDWYNGGGEIHYHILQIGASSAVGGYVDNSTYLGANWKDDGNNKYINTDEASLYVQQSGQHRFLVAPSGSADSAITWTTGIKIDNSGYVTMPNQPSIVLGGSVGGYATVNAGNLAEFNSIETQTGGSNYNTTQARYTAPVAGWYQVTFAALSQNSIEQEWLLRKNANTVRRCFHSAERQWHFSTQVYCAVNDYLDIESNTSNSNNIYMSSGGNMYSWVSYRLLG